jgi:hypothetical protein
MVRKFPIPSASEMFSTKIEDSETFLKTLYGLTYLIYKDTGNNFLFNMDIYRQDKIPYLFHTNSVPGIRRFERCLQELMAIFRPRYVVNNQDLVDYGIEQLIFGDDELPPISGARVNFLGQNLMGITISGEQAYLQFTSARDRLSIPSYLMPVLKRLPLSNVSYTIFASLLHLPGR